MRWDFGSILPPDVKYNLSEQEVCYATVYWWYFSARCLRNYTDWIIHVLQIFTW